ncbi:MAG: PQQ-binding-like beta-propeller repeat protein [Deltaproteobacteria bacterium]|nr:PQQ-binding-like beta-propeller repeat protein [Deltaproteobacteria bacterium]
MTAGPARGLLLVACGLAHSAGAAEPSDWPQSRRDAQNSAATVIEAEASGAPRAWAFDGSGRTWGYEPGMTVWTSPAVGRVAGRAVLVAGSYDHDVYCLDAASGELLYKVTTGGRVQSTPTLWSDGERSWLYVASNDRLLYGLDAANGRQLWVHAVEDYRPTLGGARLSSPVVGSAGDRPAVFVGHWVWDRSLAAGFQRGRLSAFDAREGKPLWVSELGDNEITAPIFARVKGRGVLFAGSASGAFFAIDASEGRVLWQHTELDAIKSAPALVELSGATLVVLGSKYGALRALDAVTGAERWSFKTGDRIMGSPLVISTSGRARIAVGSYDGGLYLVEAETGRRAWRYSARAGIYSSPAIALEGPRALILVSAWDHALHAVGADDGSLSFAPFTGRPLWAVSGLDASTWASPVAARINGHWMAFVGSYDGTLRALPLDDAGREAPALRSNSLFWLSFPLVLAPVILLAVALTRRDRRRRVLDGGAPSTRAQR